jgi:hypothetical protein
MRRDVFERVIRTGAPIDASAGHLIGDGDAQGDSDAHTKTNEHGDSRTENDGDRDSDTQADRHSDPARGKRAGGRFDRRVIGRCHAFRLHDDRL